MSEDRLGKLYAPPRPIRQLENCSMQALTYDRFGPVDVLHTSDIAIPKAGKGQVLVQVRATSINVIDSRVRDGFMGILVNKRFPKVPGADLAGVVSEVGVGVSSLKAGDIVYGANDPLKGGAFAEFAAVPASQLAPKPEILSFEEAAAIPVTALAALIALRDLGKVKRNDEVLIHGASGAVGLFAIQIGKAMGARITAVAGTNGVEAVRDFGADAIINYQRQDAGTFDRSFNVIVNASGKMPFAEARRFLKPNGRLVEPSPNIPTFIGSMLTNPWRGQKHLMLTTIPKRTDLDYLSQLIGEGRLKPTIAKVYTLADAKQAFRDVEKRQMFGKVVVAI